MRNERDDKPDAGENEVLYGKDLKTRDVVMGKMTPTAEGRSLITNLSRHSPVERH